MTNLDIDQIRNEMLSLKYETAETKQQKTAGYAGDRSRSSFEQGKLKEGMHIKVIK